MAEVSLNEDWRARQTDRLVQLVPVKLGEPVAARRSTPQQPPETFSSAGAEEAVRHSG